jgi:hypothetical protein
LTPTFKLTFKQDYCDAEQATRLINNYFKSEVKITEIKPQVTPAELIKKMQTTQSIEETTKFITTLNLERETKRRRRR